MSFARDFENEQDKQDNWVKLIDTLNSLADELRNTKLAESELFKKNSCNLSVSFFLSEVRKHIKSNTLDFNTFIILSFQVGLIQKYMVDKKVIHSEDEASLATIEFNAKPDRQKASSGFTFHRRESSVNAQTNDDSVATTTTTCHSKPSSPRQS